jgi:hypothetical protein
MSKKNKVMHVCTICGVDFMSGGDPARHKCKGEFKGQTGTGVPLDALPEIPVVEEDQLEIAVEDDDEGLTWEPATMELPKAGPDEELDPPPGWGTDEPITGSQDPPTTKKDRNKLEDLVMVYLAALDDKQYSTEQRTAIIANLFADTLDVRVETAQVVISQTQFGIMALLGVGLLLGKEKLKPVLGFYSKNFFTPRKDNIPDPFGD